MELITIGVVVNTHGLKGTVKVKSFTDFKEQRYAKGSTLYIAFKREMIPVTVKKYRTVKSLDFIDFDEFTDINQIEKYKGCDLMFDKELSHDLEEDEFYFDELIGMEVFTEEVIGKVIEVREVPQGELLVIKTLNKKNTLVPFNKVFVKEVNKEKQLIILNEWEGLL